MLMYTAFFIGVFLIKECFKHNKKCPEIRFKITILLADFFFYR